MTLHMNTPSALRPCDKDPALNRYFAEMGEETEVFGVMIKMIIVKDIP